MYMYTCLVQEMAVLNIVSLNLQFSTGRRGQIRVMSRKCNIIIDLEDENIVCGS